MLSCVHCYAFSALFTSSGEGFKCNYEGPGPFYFVRPPEVAHTHVRVAYCLVPVPMFDVMVPFFSCAQVRGGHNIHMGTQCTSSSALALSSQHDAHVRAARNSDRSPRVTRNGKGARSASEMQSCWLDNSRQTLQLPSLRGRHLGFLPKATQVNRQGSSLSDVVRPSFGSDIASKMLRATGHARMARSPFSLL